jgi:ornithine carbamoyltransferase
MKDLLRIADLSATDLTRLLLLAEEARSDRHAFADVLRDELAVLYFAKPSTRTRLSFAAAVARMGGSAQVVGPAELQLGRGETIEDTAKVISRFAAAFVIRTFDDEDVRRFAGAASIPVVNALTDGHHPCQALADLLTLEQVFGSLRGLRVAYLGDGNNVAHSLLEACAVAGVDITVATPPGYEPAAEVVGRAQQIAEASGAMVRTTHDPVAAATGADAVYTDVWVSMGTPSSERSARVAALSPYRVDQRIMDLASPAGVFLHCLPAHRGDEVAAEVIDGARSVVFDQAENRLHTAVAVLVGLVQGSVGTPSPLQLAR